ncbi:MAG TPA: DUF222 domain-containing protein [Gaiellaceae bacterium]|nr:DUF222 domain-containing protein [Gaiellaceae bacterium]
MMTTEDMSVRDLQDELAALASHLYAGTCRFLELVGELDRRGDWDDYAAGSCADWLAWRCAMLPRTAREHVRVARSLPELPLTHAAFARGELSYSKVRAITRIADAESEEQLLGLARCLTAAQLERAVHSYRRVTAEESERLHFGAYFSAWVDDDGCVEFKGRLAPEDGALFLRALHVFQGRIRWERGSAEPPRTHAEALVDLADTALSSEAPTSGDRHQVIVHIDHETLAGDDVEGQCALSDGPALAPETARRLACDASIVAISERNGEPVRIGRKTRTIPPAVRRALRARDHGCRFPGCENHRWVDAHHVHHWARGGPTKLANLVLLCRRHHRMLHEGRYSVDERLRFYDPWGFEIPAVAQPPPGVVGAVVRRDDIDPGTCASGEKLDMDLELTVEAICGYKERAAGV